MEHFYLHFATLLRRASTRIQHNPPPPASQPTLRNIRTYEETPTYALIFAQIFILKRTNKPT